MTKREADKMLISKLKMVDARAENTEDNVELLDLVEAEIKLYITLCNAGAFDDVSNMTPSGMQS